nr:MAG TPA: hypothetical protein [Caudoviricetes sp.]
MKENFLASVSPVVECVRAIGNPLIKVIKEIPEIDAITERKVASIDGAVYIFPNGSRTGSQSGGGATIRETVGVGVAVCVKMNLLEGMPYYERAGEILTDIKRHLARFKPHNPRYPAQEFFLPKDGAQDPEHTYVYADGFFLLVVRYTYDTFIHAIQVSTPIP